MDIPFFKNNHKINKSIKQRGFVMDVIMYEMISLAKKGDAQAQCDLGLEYEVGYDLPKDYQKAVEWYTKAAEQGHAQAQANLGDCYHYGYGVEKDDQKAVYWQTKSAEQGCVEGQENLSFYYEWGYGVEQDYVKAHEWLVKASESAGVPKRRGTWAYTRYKNRNKKIKKLQRQAKRQIKKQSIV